MHLYRANEFNCEVSISCFVCDAPAMAYLRQIKGNNAHFDCERCVQRREWASRIIFPDTKAAHCTDADFNCTDIEEKAPLEQLFVGLVFQFVQPAIFC